MQNCSGATCDITNTGTLDGYEGADLLNTFNSSADITAVVNITDSYWDIITKDLFCTDCLTGTEIAELTDADISDTLTSSNLIAGSSVVDDSEVDDDITIATSNNITITGSGATFHIDIINSTHTKLWMS